MIFPPAFLDSSSCWNTNHNQLQPLASNNITSPSAAAAGGDHEGNNHPHDGLGATALGGGGGGGDGGAADGPAKPMSMSERARLARVPQPEPGLNCPRCDSTNTKFCYFNNYSLTQPRHFCRACRRYWTRGGALRNVPVGGGYRRHAKRAKPKATPSAAAAGPGAPTSTTPAGTCTAAAPSSLQAMLSNSAPPPSHRFADFDPASLGLSFPGAARLLFADTADAYAGGGNVHQGMEQQQWAQMQSFTFLHAMDHQMGPPATAMPATMAMQGMFHLGLQSGGGNGEDGGEQFHATPAKRDQQQDYPSSRGMYGDVSGYTFYSSSSAAGN